MPDLVKVGYSMKDPELRATELNHAGSPHPYVVDYEVLVEDPHSIEQMVHAQLKDRNEGKEWFHCSPEEAISVIQSVVGSKAQIENFKRADRVKAEAIRQQKDAEERAKRAAEEERRKREAALDAKRQEIISRYELLLKAALPKHHIIEYFVFAFFIVLVPVSLLFPKMDDFGKLTISFILGFIITPIVKNCYIKMVKKSAKYKSILEKRENELAAVCAIMPSVDTKVDV